MLQSRQTEYKITQVSAFTFIYLLISYSSDNHIITLPKILTLYWGASLVYSTAKELVQQEWSLDT